MSKAKDKAAAEVKQEAAGTVVELPAPPPPNERLHEVDRLALELAKAKRQTTLAEAKTALANNENAELSYKYVVLQIYMKYGLTDKDAISEAGEILRGGAVQVPKG